MAKVALPNYSEGREMEKNLNSSAEEHLRQDLNGDVQERMADGSTGENYSLQIRDQQIDAIHHCRFVDQQTGLFCSYKFLTSAELNFHRILFHQDFVVTTGGETLAKGYDMVPRPGRDFADVPLELALKSKAIETTMDKMRFQPHNTILTHHKWLKKKMMKKKNPNCTKDLASNINWSKNVTPMPLIPTTFIPTFEELIEKDLLEGILSDG